MILSVDFGASFVDCVYWKDGSYEKKTYPAGTRLDDIRKGAVKVYVTGGDSKRVDNVQHIDEITAIAKGGAWLAGLEQATVVSCGTGTCIVEYSQKRAKHLCGTGLGGATLLGLSRIAGAQGIAEVLELCSRGDSIAVNLTVGDICRGEIGILDQKMTAANMAKESSRQDTIAGIVRMVAENIIMLASVADNTGNIVFTGRVSTIPLFESISREFTMFDKRFHFPKDREYATAFGCLPLCPQKDENLQFQYND